MRKEKEGGDKQEHNCSGAKYMLQPEIWVGTSTRISHQENTEQPTFKKTFRFLRTYGPSGTFC